MEDRTMPPQTIENRVDQLELRVTELEKLPERITGVESQIVQLRAELRDEFSAVRQEIRQGDEETRRYMRVLHEEVIGRLAVIPEGQPTTRRKRKDK
jgi:chaperonin cofactor prefoldin